MKEDRLIIADAALGVVLQSVWRIVISLLLVANLFLLFSSGKTESHEYAKAVQVYCMNQDRNTVTFIDGAGILWEIRGIEDWELGDVAALLMDDSGTPEFIYDDKIVEAMYGFNVFYG